MNLPNTTPSNKTLKLCCFETDNQNDSGLLAESSFQLIPESFYGPIHLPHLQIRK